MLFSLIYYILTPINKVHTMNIVNIIERFRSLPGKNRGLLGLGAVLGLFVALPLFVWAIVTQNFNSNKRAASGDPVPTPSPTPTPFGNVSQSFYIGMKFAGVTDGSADGARVTLRFQNSPNWFDYVTSPVVVRYIGNGVYQAWLTFGSDVPPLPANNYYSIYLKGEKHLSTKFCQATGQTVRCTGNGNISIPTATVNPNPFILDFTGIPLTPGDLPPQDGVANSTDFNIVKALLNKSCSNQTDTDILTADLNYDKCVNIKDIFMMRQTLETRYDEN